MIARVSNVEYFRQWRDDEETDLDALLVRLRGLDEPSEPMKAGIAFHKALETALPGEHAVMEANGYSFHVDEDLDIALVLPEIRELRASKEYGALTITGCVDVIEGRRVEDHKTTGQFNADRFLEGYQWRLYLDIFGADVFRWNVFEISPMPDREKSKRKLEGNVYRVHDLHTLEQYRYPGLSRDCAKLADDFGAFAAEYLPELREVE